MMRLNPWTFIVLAWLAGCSVNFVRAQDLVAHWTFDEGSGLTAGDSSGNGHIGTLSNGPAWTTGVKSGALSFDGIDDQLIVPKTTQLEPTNAITVAVWGKISSTRAGQFADLLRKSGNGDGYLLRWSHGDGYLQFRIDKNGATTLISAKDTQLNSAYLNEWHHFAGTFDSATGNVQLYVDGQLKNSATQAGFGAMTHSDDLKIMSSDQSNPGIVDDVRIYNRALSQAEINALAQLPPIAVADRYGVNVNASLNVPSPGVLQNDTDVNNDAIAAVLNNSTSNGALVLNANGSFSYTPNAGFAGTDSFTYQASDSGGNVSDPVSVTITVETIAISSVSPAAGITGRNLTDVTLTGTGFRQGSAPPKPAGSEDYNGHSYLLVKTPMMWVDAKAYCESLGGHLVTFSSQAEENFVRSMNGLGSVIWIGLSDTVQEGQFAWVTGEPLTYTHWGSGQPDNSGGAEDYGELYLSIHWNDSIGTYLKDFVCEFESASAPTVKLKNGTTEIVASSRFVSDSELKFDVVLSTTEYGFWDVEVTNPDGGASVTKPLAFEVLTEPFQDINAGLTGLAASEIAWGDYDNDGKLDLVVMGNQTGNNSGMRVFLYRNTGTEFSAVTTNLVALEQGTLVWGDYNGDGHIDLVQSGWTGGSPHSVVYANNSGVFTSVFNPRGFKQGGGRWLDYDNDGDLDLLVTGENSSFNGPNYTLLYRNNGANSFTEVASFAGVRASEVDVADFDNDGDMDMLVSGENRGSFNTNLYRNDGGTFTNVSTVLPPAEWPSVAWGDYDSDGDMDLAFSGNTPAGFVTGVYRNDNGVLVKTNANIALHYFGEMIWGDYDNDGDLDLAVIGRAPDSSRVCKLYRNDAGQFADSGIILPATDGGDIAWGDYDGDGRLDLALTGQTNNGYVTRIYRNMTGAPANTPPSAPGNLLAKAHGQQVRFSWDAATDSQTPVPGLSYNLRVGTAPGLDNISAGMADAAGLRKVVREGNAQKRTVWTLNLPLGTYYWSVQAIDSAFAGSTWAPEQSIVVDGTLQPTITVSQNPIVVEVNQGQGAVTSNLDLTNAGIGSFNWTLTTDVPWLSVLPQSESTSTETDTLQITIDPAGLAASATSRVGKIIITAPEAYNSPLIVDVTLTVRGLIAHWPLNEGTGTTTTDATGNGNTGTLINGPAWTTGIIGNALSFDGQNDALKVPNGLLMSQIQSVSLWFKTTATGVMLGYQNTAYPTNPTSQVPVLYVGTDGRLRGEFWYGASAPITSAAPVNDNKWHMAVIVGNNNSQSLFLDGQLVGSQSGTINHLDLTHNQFGVGYTILWPAATGAWFGFNGLLDDLRIYNRALSQTEIQALIPALAPTADADLYAMLPDRTLSITAPGVLLNDSDYNGDAITAVKLTDPANGSVVLNSDGSFTYTPAAGFTGTDSFTYAANDGIASSAAASVTIQVGEITSGLVAHWKLDDGSGSSASDSSGNSFTGTLFNTPGWTAGTHNGALNFNGSNQYVNVPVSPDMGGGSMTVAGWIYRESGTERKFVSKWNDTAAKFQFDCQVYQDSKAWFQVLQSNNTGKVAQGTTVIETGRWYHYAGVADASTSTLAIYINGVREVLQNNPAWDGTIKSANMELNIGRKATGNHYWSGKLDDIQIFNRALSPLEIKTLADKPPSAVADQYTFAVDTQLVTPAPGVLANDTDPELSALSAELVSGPAAGSLVLNVDGSFQFTPPASYAGPPLSFSYRARDGLDHYSNTVVVILTGPAPQIIAVTPDASDKNSTVNLTLSGNNLPTFTGTLSTAGTVRLDGIDDYFVIPSSSLINSPNITIESWVKILPNEGGLRVHKRNGSGFNWEQFEFIVHANGKVVFWVANGGRRTPQTSIGTLNLGWNHVAVSFDGSTQRIFINGVLDSEVTVTWGIQPFTEDMFLGREPHFNNVYDGGTLSEFRFWKVARSQAEIAATMNTVLSGGHPDLVLRYDFSNGGPNLVDTTGNGHSGTGSGGPEFGYEFNVDPVMVRLKNGATARVSTGTLTSTLDSLQCTVNLQGLPGGVYDVELLYNGSVVAALPGGFAVRDLILTAPTASQIVLMEQAHNIAWTQAGLNNIKIELSRNGGTDWETITPSTPASAGGYSWLVDGPPSANGIIRLSDADGGSISAVSALFTVDLKRFVEVATTFPQLLSSAAAWGDFDNDGDLDLAVCGSETAPITRVYRNDGSGAFTDIQANLIGAESSPSLAWGDYDNDGLLDLVVAGASQPSGAAPLTTLYHNDGGGVFSVVNAGFPGVKGCTVAWGDYDNDGRLDLVVSGTPSSGVISTIYRNNGGGQFAAVFSTNSIGAYSGSWADYDKDGDLDLLLLGTASPAPASSATTKLFRNDNGSFVETAPDLPAIAKGSEAWGDYDNDGLLDLALSGNPYTSKIFHYSVGAGFIDINSALTAIGDGLGRTAAAWADIDNDGNVDLALSGRTSTGLFTTKIYGNQGGGAFINVNTDLVGVKNCSTAWGDFDNDGKIDVFIAGQIDDTGTRVSKLYRNNALTANTPPTPPTGLIATQSVNDLTFSWNTGSDAETPATGLSYNLRVGTTLGGNDIFSGSADASGFRRLPSLGNVQKRQSWTLKNLSSNTTYYWSVQAIDSAYSGSAWESDVFTTVGGNAVAVDGTLTTQEDTAATGMFTATGTYQNFVLVSGGSKGVTTLTDAATGAYEYTPNLNANGTDTITFRARDGVFNSNLGTITVTINSVNDAPVAAGASIQVNENTVKTGTLSASDAENQPLNYVLVSNGSKGSVTINSATGAYSYTPNQNASGADKFRFKVSDGVLESNIADVNININLVNDPPVAQDGTLQASEDIAASGLLQSADPDGPGASYIIVTNGSLGTAVITNSATGAYTYTSNQNVSGTDTFAFQVSDGSLTSNLGLVVVTISPINDAPVASSGTLNTNEDAAASGNLSAADIDSSTLSYSIVSNPLKGIVDLNAATGAYVYTPFTNENGPDSFTFKVSDEALESNVAQINIQITPQFDPLTTLPLTLNTAEDVPVPGILAVVNEDKVPVVFSIVNNGAKGIATIVAASAGSFVYVPNLDATGADSFTFKVTTNGIDSNTATVFVNIAAANDAPRVNSAMSATPNPAIRRQVIQFSLTASDVEGDPLSYEWNFGDGTSSTLSAPTHAYDIAGLYTVTVAVSDGIGGVTQQSIIAEVQVGAPSSPTGDLDGDGFSNAIEEMMGTNPGDASSKPGGTGDADFDGVPDDLDGDDDNNGVDDQIQLADGKSPYETTGAKLSMTITRFAGKASFNSVRGNQFSASGVIPNIAAGFNPAGAPVSVNVGGASVLFMLDEKGRAKSDKNQFALRLKLSKRDPKTGKRDFPGGNVPFKVKAVGSWLKAWADEGIDPVKSAKNEPLQVVVDLVLNGSVYTSTLDTKYSAKANVGGTFKN